MGGAITVDGGTITSTSGTWTAVSGTAPNGNTWGSYVTGTSPVAYFDPGTGTLMLDPKGKNVSILDFRYGTFGTVNSGTPGPYVFTTGTGGGAVSTSAIERTLPAGTWTQVTTWPARLRAGVSLSGQPTLATSGGNIASTNGWFNEPWSFGPIAPSVTQESMYSTTDGQGFRASSGTGAAPVDLLGYGNGYGMFVWTEGSDFTSQFGAVIPIQPVPEPSTWAMGAAGLACAAWGAWRRRKRA